MAVMPILLARKAETINPILTDRALAIACLSRVTVHSRESPQSLAETAMGADQEEDQKDLLLLLRDARVRRRGLLPRFLPPLSSLHRHLLLTSQPGPRMTWSKQFRKSKR